MPLGIRRNVSIRRQVVAALALLAAASTAFAQQESSGPPTSHFPTRGSELTPETVKAIDDGIDWLAREQIDSSGRWPCSPTRYQMSITSLAGLALLAHGETPETGTYARNVRRCLEWIMDSQIKEGEFAGLLYDSPKGSSPLEQKERSTHGHGFALLFLAQCYGQTRNQHLRTRLHKAITMGVRLTERSISPDGGWYYHPGSRVHGPTRDEGSVTITQIQALRASRNAGIHVEPNTIRRAVDYIKKSQQADGGIRYTLKWGRTSAALTAAGIAVLQGAGEYHSEAIEKAYAFLRQKLKTDLPDRQRFFFYTHLYGAQAMFQRGGPEWSSYFPRIRRELLEMRHGKPYWDSSFGRSYGTAISLLILQLPQRYLPIYQR